jgi:hypothetical protein
VPGNIMGQGRDLCLRVKTPIVKTVFTLSSVELRPVRLPPMIA